MISIKLLSITTDKSLRDCIKHELNHAYRLYFKDSYLFRVHMCGFYKGLLEANKIGLDRYNELCLKLDMWISEKELGEDLGV